MKSVVYKKYGIIKVEHIWFAQSFCEKSKATISLYHGIFESSNAVLATEAVQRRPFRGGVITKQKTLISDLMMSEEDLWSKIKKNTRYEIRRAKKDINIRVNQYRNIPDELLMKFKSVYDEMYAAKGIKNSFNTRLILEYMKQDMIYFSVAYYKDDPLVFHSYIYDENHARLYYSCSPFRSESEIATLIGRMNRLLHWEDFIYFKRIGIKEYDWGGINSTDKPNHIAKFKLCFGGNPVIKNNYLLVSGLIGKCLLKIYFYFKCGTKNRRS